MRLKVEEDQEFNLKHCGRPRQVDHLRSGVQDQPDQHGETLSLLKIQKFSQGWWRMPVIPATWDAEGGESLESGRWRLWEYESKDGRGSMVNLCEPVNLCEAEINIQNKEQHNNQKQSPTGQVRWLTPVTSALWEAKEGRSPEHYGRLKQADHLSSRPAWPTWRNLIPTKNTKISQAWWCMLVISATQEAKARESLGPVKQRLHLASFLHTIPKLKKRRGFSMLVKLVSNSRPQVIRPPRPPKMLGLQASSTTPGQKLLKQEHTRWEAKAGGLQDQEFQTSPAKIYKNCWVWWRTPVVPAARQTEVGESLEAGRQRLRYSHRMNVCNLN
ncbi:putative uncharacterized protein C8orf44 [Plecturocebus cupreus]